METLKELLLTPFAAGLGLGLLITFFTWKSAFAAKRQLKTEIKRTHEESRDLLQHLNTQLKVNAEGNESLQKKLESLKTDNENLRINLATVQQKPGRAELRQLTIIENAIGVMREQAPGFAQAWEKALRQSESDYESGESGLKRIVRKVLPNLSHSPPTQDQNLKED